MSIILEKTEGNITEVVVSSSNLNRAIYNSSENHLSIEFNNGSIYEYENVPLEIFENFKKSESQGKFFNSNISRTYKYKKIK
jgi:lysyl-tRNA synthetase class 2